MLVFFNFFFLRTRTLTHRTEKKNVNVSNKLFPLHFYFHHSLMLHAVTCSKLFNHYFIFRPSLILMHSNSFHFKHILRMNLQMDKFWWLIKINKHFGDRLTSYKSSKHSIPKLSISLTFSFYFSASAYLTKNNFLLLLLDFEKERKGK